MADEFKLYLRSPLAPGASDVFYLSRADGSADGTCSFTGAASVIGGVLAGTVAPLSHSHAISDITGLQAALEAKLVQADIGVTVQAHSASLTTFAEIAPSANVQTLLGAADFAALRTSLSLVVGTNVQGFNIRLADLAGITYAQGDILCFDGSNLVKLAAGTNGHFLKTQGAGANPVWASTSAGALADGDYGDITISGSGLVFMIDAAAVSLSKIANASASSRLLGSGASGSGSSYAELSLGSGVQMSGTTLRGADYYTHRLITSTANGTDLSWVTSTNYALAGNFFFTIDLDTFTPTHFRIVVGNGAMAAGTGSFQLTTGASATAVLHTGGNDLTFGTSSGTQDSGWRTFDNPSALTGFQTLAFAYKSSGGSTLMFRYMEIHFKR